MLWLYLQCRSIPYCCQISCCNNRPLESQAMVPNRAEYAERAVPLTPVRMRTGVKKSASVLPFLIPALTIYVIFLVYPIISAIFMSFFNWDGVSPNRVFVGLDNYVYLFTKDDIFWRSLRNSGVWVVLSLLVPTTFGLTLALALNQKMTGRSIFRMIFYLPAIIASIAVATIWSWMYNPSLGLINGVLKQIGLKILATDWLGNRDIALYSVFAAYTWMATGPNMVLFLAGLQGVPQDLVEAARVDGANRRQVFWSVTIPSLRPTFVVVIALSIINSLKVFDLIYGMTYGGPGDSTNVLASWSYFQAFSFNRYGLGMAVAVVLLLITLVIIVPYVIWANRGED
jgi:raffinose/stachyose/melibiose transport system permease protein